MPSKLTNILAAGIVSIATVDLDTAVYKVLNGHDCGVTIPPESAAELTASIAALADDAEWRENLGRTLGGTLRPSYKEIGSFRISKPSYSS